MAILQFLIDDFLQTSVNLFWESCNPFLQSGHKRENIGDVPYCEVPFVIVVVVHRNFRFLQRLRRQLSDVRIVKLALLKDQDAFLNIVGIVVHWIRMLNNDAAPTAYSYVAFGFDPYYAISVAEPGLQHEPGDISNNRILLTL